MATKERLKYLNNESTRWENLIVINNIKTVYSKNCFSAGVNLAQHVYFLCI